jgi:zinc/manganese transport system ATP-binding protein
VSILDVRGVSVRLSGREILHDVSFGVEAGQFTGLIGSNGAGKTTVIRVILGLVAPTEGRVLVAERPGSGRNTLVGYVPQKIDFDPDMPLRAKDFVGLGLDGHRFGIPRPNAARRARIDKMLDAVDATAFSDARLGELSGGEQQRVMIAHALINRPKLLLLDEPLANLDLRSEQEVVALLARISSDQQVAVLISAHDMNPLMGSMDHIVYMASGRAMSGTTDEVVRTETLSALYGHHVEVLHVQDRIIVVAGRADSVAGHSDLAALVELVQGVP